MTMSNEVVKLNETKLKDGMLQANPAVATYEYDLQSYLQMLLERYVDIHYKDKLHNFETIFERMYNDVIFKYQPNIDVVLQLGPPLIDSVHFAVILYLRIRQMRELTKYEYKVLRSILEWEILAANIHKGHLVDAKEHEHSILGLTYFEKGLWSNVDNAGLLTAVLEPTGFYQSEAAISKGVWKWKATQEYDKKFSKIHYCHCCGQRVGTGGFGAYCRYIKSMPEGDDYARCAFICRQCSVRKKHTFEDCVFDQIRMNFSLCYETLTEEVGSYVYHLYKDFANDITDTYKRYVLPKLLVGTKALKVESRLSVAWNGVYGSGGMYAIRSLPYKKEDLRKFNIDTGKLEKGRNNYISDNGKIGKLRNNMLANADRYKNIENELADIKSVLTKICEHLNID